MAEMIPEKIPSKASKGEQRLFSILSKLPDDCIVYYEALVNRKNPDFIVIIPQLGVLIIEVKGWYAAEIVRANSNEVLVRTSDGSTTPTKHPNVQAREYKFALMDYCRKHRQIAGELFENASNRFGFPFCHMTVLSNVSESRLVDAEWNAVFPAELCVSKDTLLRWESLSNADQVIQELIPFFRPFWKFPPLLPNQVLRLRTIIHPEILIHVSNTEAPENDLKALDLRQERNARTLGEGHRIIYGIAGSGKTVLLIARAKLISEQNPQSRILVLCYNVTLRAYLSSCLREHKNVDVRNFHQWARMPFEKNEDPDLLGERWLAQFESRPKLPRDFYDTILVDEAQDFAPSWFRCVVASLRDPENGDLLLVHDGHQGLYGDKKVRWKDVGVRAQGRTQRNDLVKNYRNTGEILRLATRFSRASDADDTSDLPALVSVDPTLCQRRFHPPMLLGFSTRAEELQAVRDITEKLTTGKFEPLPGYQVQPSEIAILYRVTPKHPEFDQLKDSSSVTWLNRSPGDREKVNDTNTKLLTIHSSKGLQFRVVIIICCDDMPARFPDTSVVAERSAGYVALTRAEELLIMTHTGSSEFVREVMSSRLVDLVELP
ncbi:MAG: 3'-5' exonuclease [Planctomycetaceae bacterium]